VSGATLAKIGRSPVLHFLLLGTLLYAAAAFARDPLPPGARRIVVTSGQLNSFAETWARAWKRPPTREEFLGLARDHVREEMAVREARALGLDRDDPIIRRRLAQKVEFLADDLASLPEPDDAALAAHLTSHPDRFARRPLVEVRDAVREDWIAQQRREGRERRMEQIRAKYEIVVERGPR
jgi:hypothetical protein